MTTAYVEHGDGKKALQLYAQMQEEGVSPNHQTFVAELQACGSLVDEAEDIISKSLIVMLNEISHSLHTDSKQYSYTCIAFSLQPTTLLVTNFDAIIYFQFLVMDNQFSFRFYFVSWPVII